MIRYSFPSPSREVDMRNRYATFEAIFVHQKWHSRCINRLSRHA
ncbi:hypothetical protein HMPREF3214_00265 [Alloscardovia omnicolens]|nr:hypothetical protein HMPREF3214_00265 [Alloscardovia omnicolens]